MFLGFRDEGLGEGFLGEGWRKGIYGRFFKFLGGIMGLFYLFVLVMCCVVFGKLFRGFVLRFLWLVRI